MKNMASMMKQAQQMQANMKKVQNELETVEVEGTAGNGVVKVTMTCKNLVKGVSIDPAIVDSDDVETLEDMVTVAIQDANTKIQQEVESRMSAVTGGMNIPGLM